MKKYIIILCITLLLIVILGTYETTPKEITTTSNITETDIPVTNPAIITRNQEDEILYIARDLNGYIAIFLPDQLLPCLTTDINVKTLPLADQEKLKTGINLDKNYDLAKFIEDYSS